MKIKLCDSLYLKDPEETKLGKKIISESINLINNLGLEKFTLKKLAQAINSNEPSIYRYFENKYQILAYLHSWYWSWIEFNINQDTKNILDPKDKLDIVLHILLNSTKYDDSFPHIDETKLSNIVVKCYQGNFIDQNDTSLPLEDMYKSFDSLCMRLSDIIKEYDNSYPNPYTLSSSIIKIIHDQLFFMKNKTKSHTEINTIEELDIFIKKTIYSILS